jgi:hypothetical protein
MVCGANGRVPEVKPQYCQKKKKEKKNLFMALFT